MGKGARFRTRIPAAVVATALICVILVSFIGVRDSGTAEVRRMLEKRTAVMENVLSGRITYDDGKSELMEIEDGSLLSDDLGSLKAYEDTDYEPVQDMIFAGIKKQDLYTVRAVMNAGYAGYTRITEVCTGRRLYTEPVPGSAAGL